MASLHSVSLRKARVSLRPLFLGTSIKQQVLPSQKTIYSPATCKGIGVHSGASVTLTLLPAPVGSGITFVRTDANGAEIKASWETVIDTRFCTTLGNAAGVTISTIEHLMAALAAQGIDNIRVAIDGPELPIMDGSAQTFFTLLAQTGLKDQRLPRRVVRVLKPITVEEGDRKVSLSPSSLYELEAAVGFTALPSLGSQHHVFRPFHDDFAATIASARTFGFLEEAEKIWAMGLAKGASLENTLVYEGEKILNEGGARYENECARHKILDALGDLHLAGGLIFGKFYGKNAGHTLHCKLLQALFEDPTAWTCK